MPPPTSSGPPALRPERLLTVGEAARLLHVHPNTLREWSDKGLVKAYRIGPRHDRRFRRRDIQRLLEEAASPPTS